jgi:hypothetical protein
MYELKSVGVLRLGLIMAVLYALAGLIEGLIMGPLMAMAPAGTRGFPAFFGYGAIVFFPIVGAITGLIGGIIAGFLYNLVAKWTGGLLLNFVIAAPAESLSAL